MSHNFPSLSHIWTTQGSGPGAEEGTAAALGLSSPVSFLEPAGQPHSQGDCETQRLLSAAPVSPRCTPLTAALCPVHLAGGIFQKEKEAGNNEGLSPHCSPQPIGSSSQPNWLLAQTTTQADNVPPAILGHDLWCSEPLDHGSTWDNSHLQ